MDMAQGGNAHVKKILPPSLGGMPGEAEIQYYVKATVQRPAFYKENFRAVSKLRVMGIFSLSLDEKSFMTLLEGR